MYKNAIENISNGDYILGMNEIVKLFNEKTYDMELLNLLEEIFVTPNKENMLSNYEKNVELLLNYPYIFKRNFKKQEENTFEIFPVDNNIFYEYNKNDFKFEKIEVNSTKETKYFFEFLDKPLFVENEFNEFNLNFLVDNVRASEYVAYENHIYLYYDSIDVFTKLLYYCELEHLLKDNKIVFLFGEEKSMYPINFKEKFDVDYDAMEFQEVRPYEITRITTQHNNFSCSGHVFFIEILDNHKDLLNIHFNENGFFYYYKDFCIDSYINFIKLILLYKTENPSCSLKKTMNSVLCTKNDEFYRHIINCKTELMYCFDGIEYSEEKKEKLVFKYLNELVRICDKYSIENIHDYFCSAFLAFEYSIGYNSQSRITPMLHAISHNNSQQEFIQGADLFNTFKYCYHYDPVRDPISTIASSAKIFSGKSGMINYDLNAIVSNNPMFKNIINDDFFYIRFEDLKLNPKATLISFCEYLNIPYSTSLEVCSAIKGYDGATYNKHLADNHNMFINGYSVKALYNDISNYLTDFDIQRIELILFPFYEIFGYTPINSPEDILTNLQSITSKPFLAELNNIDLTDEAKILLRENLAKLYIMSSNIDKNSFKKNIHLKPKEEYSVNKLYTNRANLPKLDNVDVDFISKTLTTNKTYWITGLSGSGKTTISKALLTEIQKKSEKVIFLDGDDMREHIASDLGYELEDRKQCALRYAKLCKMLSKQGFIIICATISMFDEVRDWNRENIDNYVEVYVKVSEETLAKRNQKDMYSNNTPNLMGVDIKPEYPKKPHIILENDQGDIDEFIHTILNFKEN